MDTSDYVRLALLFLALAVSAIFSATEAAYMSVQRGRLAALKRTDPAKANRVERFSSQPEKLLSTVLTGNNLANTAAAALGTGLALSFLSENNAVIASTIGVTILLLIFSEAIPKTIATRYSVGLSVFMAPILRVVEAVLLPPVWLLERLVRGVTYLLGLPETTLVSQEEITALADLARETGVVEPSQAEVVGNVFRIEDRQLREVMTPRNELVALQCGATLDDFWSLYRDHPHSRYPIFDGSIDNIVGTLSLQDVVQALANGEIHAATDVTDLAQQPIFLPETNIIGEFMRRRRDSSYQMVILADEYGGVAGLVTFKEVVDEVLGPMGSEGDAEDNEVRPLGGGSYLVDAGMQVDELNSEVGIAIPEGDYETVAGFVMTRLGVVPKGGERIQNDDFVVEVTTVEGIKIEEVTLTKLAPPDSATRSESDSTG